MKNLLFGLIATVLLSLNSFGQSLEEKLKDLEGTSLKLEQDNDKFPFESIKSDNNSYDNNGLELYNAIKEIDNIIKEQKEKKVDYVKEVKPLIDNLQSKLPFKDLELNNDEQLLFDSFIKDIDINTALVKAKLYEDFISKNYKNQDEVKNMLIILSEFKYISYETARGSRSLSGFESCVDSCMDRTFSHYNAVDWFIFIAGNPGRAVLQVFASCGWDCW